MFPFLRSLSVKVKNNWESQKKTAFTQNLIIDEIYSLKIHILGFLSLSNIA